MCREIRYPEQWKVLKKKGAQIVFHINNALQPKDAIWEQLLVTRAYENQMFVCSVNTFNDTSQLPSFLISPLGNILFQAPTRKQNVTTVDIDMHQVQNSVLDEERNDLVNLQYT
jgi:predicted amidohydrolase